MSALKSFGQKKTRGQERADSMNLRIIQQDADGMYHSQKIGENRGDPAQNVGIKVRCWELGAANLTR